MPAQEMKFRRLGLVVKSGEERANKTFLELRDLLVPYAVEVFFVGEVPEKLRLDDIPCIAEEEIGKYCDLLIIIGGDGSFLRFAKRAAHHRVPMLGINLGRVGFLTDLAYADMPQFLPRILQGDCGIGNAMLLQGKLVRDGEVLCVRQAFNDLVVQSRSGRMLELSVFINDSFVYAERSDGLIAATPSGSTAYALSAGGSIVTPGIAALGLINISPHTLSHRPLVLSSDSRIHIVIEEGKNIAFYADGWGEQKVLPGDAVEIEKAQEEVILIHPHNYDFFAACREKLGWHSKPKLTKD